MKKTKGPYYQGPKGGTYRFGLRGNKIYENAPPGAQIIKIINGKIVPEDTPRAETVEQKQVDISKQSEIIILDELISYLSLDEGKFIYPVISINDIQLDIDVNIIKRSYTAKLIPLFNETEFDQKLGGIKPLLLPHEEWPKDSSGKLLTFVAQFRSPVIAQQQFIRLFIDDEDNIIEMPICLNGKFEDSNRDYYPEKSLRSFRITGWKRQDEIPLEKLISIVQRNQIPITEKTIEDITSLIGPTDSIKIQSGQYKNITWNKLMKIKK